MDEPVKVTVHVVMDIGDFRIEVNAESNEKIESPSYFLDKVHKVVQEQVRAYEAVGLGERL